MNPVTLAFLSVILVSVIAVITIIPFFTKKKISEKTLLLLVSLSAGTLFGTVFLHFLPESFEHGYTVGTALSILGGLLAFFFLEKLVHFHHHHKNPTKAHKQVHSHAYHLAPLNIIGDALHNFIDGIVIGASYLVSIPLGVSATIGIIVHELPQEIADFGVLLHSGWSKKKALLFNFLAATTAIVGTIIGVVLASRLAGFTQFIIPFTAGGFLYIAGSNLVPELHKHCKIKDSILHIIMLLIGIGIMVALVFIAPAHAHGG